jgi:hypothetical protein
MEYFTKEQEQKFYKLLDATAREHKTNINRIMTQIRQDENVQDIVQRAGFNLYYMINPEERERWSSKIIHVNTTMTSKKFNHALKLTLLNYIKNDLKKCISIPNKNFNIEGTIFELSDYVAKVLTKGDTYLNGSVWNSEKPGLHFLIKNHGVDYNGLLPVIKKQKAVINGTTVEPTPAIYHLETFYKQSHKPIYESFPVHSGYPEISDNEYCQLCEKLAQLHRNKTNFKLSYMYNIPDKAYTEYVLEKNVPFNGIVKDVLLNNHVYSYETNKDIPRSYYEKREYPIFTEKEFIKRYNKFLDNQCNNWKQISKKQYEKTLTAFPPMDYRNDMGFFIPDATNGDVHGFFIEKDGKFYHSQQRKSYKRFDIIKNLDTAIAESKSPLIKKYHELLISNLEKNLSIPNLVVDLQFDDNIMIIRNIISSLKNEGFAKYPEKNTAVTKFLESTGFNRIGYRKESGFNTVYLFDINKKAMDEANIYQTKHDLFVENRLFERLSKLKENKINENAFTFTLYAIGFKGNIEQFSYDLQKNSHQISSTEEIYEFLKNRYANKTITKPSPRDVEQYAVNTGLLVTPANVSQSNVVQREIKSRSR